MKKSRLGAAAVSITALALILSACGGSSGGSSAGGSSAGASSAPAATGGTFSVASEEPQNLISSNCYDLYCANVLNMMYTGLFRFETTPEGTVIPVTTELVESITTSDGGTTWSIKLTDGWTFTNGEAITAQTFADTWNFAAYGDNGQQLGFVFGSSQLNVVGYDDVAANKTKTMSGLTVAGPLELQMKLVSPLGEGIFYNFLAGPQIFPMPSVALTDVEAFNKNPIGNGQYMMNTPWVPNQKIVIDKNPNYLGTPGNADSIEFRIYNDTTAEWADLQANNVDVVPQIPQAALSTAASVLGDRFVNLPGALSFSYSFFPLQSSTFAKKEVRQAIAKAINMDQINEKLLFNTQTKATAFAPSTIPGGGTDACGDSCVYDPAAAKALLDSVGGIPGNKVQIAALQGSPNTVAKAECDQIQTNLGVNCTLKLFPDFGALLDAYAKITAADAGFIGGLGWGADNPTLQNMIAPLFGTDSPSNYIGYSNPKFDALISEGNAAADPATQIAKWQEAQEVFYDDFAAYATSWRNTTYGYSTNVSNVIVNPQGFINLDQIQVLNQG